MELEEAPSIAEQLLAPLGDRWRHARAVGHRAQEVNWILSDLDRRFLVAAAYLHDVGYAPSLRRTGLHQLDGAHYVRSLGQERLASLIAHHSESRFEVQLRGFRHELDLYDREESWTADALTYCDLTTGPLGQPMTLEERIAEVEQRYGQGDIVAALWQASPYLTAAVVRTQERLRQCFDDG
jgi:HD superfamily phosphodiesterase